MNAIPGIAAKETVEKYAEPEDKLEPQLDQVLYSILLRMGVRLESYEGRYELC